MEAIEKKALDFIANNMGKEEEYAGRIETWCFYCGAYQDPKEGIIHKKDCLHIEVVLFLESHKPLIGIDPDHEQDIYNEQDALSKGKA